MKIIPDDMKLHQHRLLAVIAACRKHGARITNTIAVLRLHQTDGITTLDMVRALVGDDQRHKQRNNNIVVSSDTVLHAMYLKGKARWTDIWGQELADYERFLRQHHYDPKKIYAETAPVQPPPPKPVQPTLSIRETTAIIAHNIKTARLNVNWGQRSAAGKLRVDVLTYQNYEYADVAVTYDQLQVLAECFKTDMAALLDGVPKDAVETLRKASKAPQIKGVVVG